MARVVDFKVICKNRTYLKKDIKITDLRVSVFRFLASKVLGLDGQKYKELKPSFRKDNSRLFSLISCDLDSNNLESLGFHRLDFKARVGSISSLEDSDTTADKYVSIGDGVYLKHELGKAVKSNILPIPTFRFNQYLLWDGSEFLTGGTMQPTAKIIIHDGSVHGYKPKGDKFIYAYEDGSVFKHSGICKVDNETFHLGPDYVLDSNLKPIKKVQTSASADNKIEKFNWLYLNELVRDKPQIFITDNTKLFCTQIHASEAKVQTLILLNDDTFRVFRKKNSQLETYAYYHGHYGLTYDGEFMDECLITRGSYLLPIKTVSDLQKAIPLLIINQECDYFRIPQVLEGSTEFLQLYTRTKGDIWWTKDEEKWEVANKFFIHQPTNSEFNPDIVVDNEKIKWLILGNKEYIITNFAQPSGADNNKFYVPETLHWIEQVYDLSLPAFAGRFAQEWEERNKTFYLHKSLISTKKEYDAFINVFKRLQELEKFRFGVAWSINNNSYYCILATDTDSYTIGSLDFEDKYTTHFKRDEKLPTTHEILHSIWSDIPTHPVPSAESLSSQDSADDGSQISYFL